MWKNRRRKREVLVSGGVDIKDSMTASKKGMYFSGGEQEFKTYSVQNNIIAGWELILLDLDTGVRYVQRFQKQIWIGRQASSAVDSFLELNHDKRISKVHCSVYEADGSLCLHDQRSKNHTYVNGKRFDSPVWIKQGDVIELGNTRLKIEGIIRHGKKR